MNIDAEPLRGALVRLEPLTEEHVPGLALAAEEDRSAYGYTMVPRAAGTAAYVEAQLARDGVTPFAQVRTADGAPVGCTSYCNPRTWPGRDGLSALEIGGTWLAGSARRTGINAESKLLLMTYAFETLNVARVDFRTDARNERSCRALERLGARFEGVLRNWGPSWVPGEEGMLRDSAIFSVIAAEWPQVRSALARRLQRLPHRKRGRCWQTARITLAGGWAISAQARRLVTAQVPTVPPPARPGPCRSGDGLQRDFPGLVTMAGTESLNLPRLVEQAEAVYRAQTDRMPPADARAATRRAGHLSWFVRLSLDEPDAMRHMQGTAEKLRGSPRLDALLPQVLDCALALTGADFGNVQLLDPASGALVIVTQSGFGPEFTDYFAVVDDEHSACGRAARDCAQTVIADVTTDPGFAPHREIAAAAGFRAVQSTPLADSRGRLVGMVSTHWRRAGRPPGRDLRLLELFGDLAGEAVARRLGPASGPAGPRPAGSGGDDPWYQPDGELAPPATALEEFAGQVVRRLFTAGLSLASAQAIIGDGAAGDRVAAAVDELDRSIRDIRAMMFPDPDRRRSSARPEPGR